MTFALVAMVIITAAAIAVIIQQRVVITELRDQVHAWEGAARRTVALQYLRHRRGE